MHILPCSGRHTVVKRQPFFSKRAAHDATWVKFKTWLMEMSDRRRQSVSRTRQPPRPPGNQRSQGQHRRYDRIDTLWACVDANRAIHLSRSMLAENSAALIRTVTLRMTPSPGRFPPLTLQLRGQSALCGVQGRGCGGSGPRPRRDYHIVADRLHHQEMSAIGQTKTDERNKK